MKILFLSDNFPPETNAPATRTMEHCKEWVKKGAEVTIITCAPNFPKGKVYDGYENKRSEELIDGIRVIRVKTFIAANAGFVRRILDYMSFAFMSFFAGLPIKTDIIVATSPQFFTTFSGCLLSFFKRKPWIFELRDLWPESIITVGAMKKGVAYKILEKIELFLYRRAKKVIPVTQSFKRNLIGRGIDPNKIEVVTNGSNIELFKPMEKDGKLLHNLGLEDKIVVGYIGTHGMAHALDFILNCFSKITDQKIHLLMIGDGAKKQSLVEHAKSLGLKNVTFLDPVQKENIPEYISITDITLAPLKRSDTFKTVIPSKIFEAAAMKKPILLGVEGESKEIIERYNAGIAYIPEDERSFLEALSEMVNDKAQYAEYQKGCEQMAHDFDRKLLADKMLEIIKSAVDEK